jgi:oligopeptide transport system permease protein
VRLAWDALPSARGHRVYRNLFPVGPELAYGIPRAEFFDNSTLTFEDRLDIKPGTYYYTIVTLNADGSLSRETSALTVDVQRVTTVAEARERGLVANEAALVPGDRVELALHPLGTDYLGRDMLARLMAGARVSLFIGIGAPLCFVLFGVFFGSVAGFIGGKTDQVMMRFADFVVALPFLLFMILFKIAFGIGPGESGVMPMLVALVLLMWPATARLVRGQILQIREQGYISASQLLGAKTHYLILRHMLPNTLGVVLVTLTFAIPSAIFTEAFLSFIGMGVAPPTPSWGSMSNEGIKTMLTTPHELIFPAALISTTVLAFNLLGDGLRDALDARMRNRE